MQKSTQSRTPSLRLRRDAKAMRHTAAILCLVVAQAHALARSTLQNTTVYQTLPRLECSKETETNKAADVRAEPIILFVHVFKAAGSSVRGIFRRYAEKCNKRWACLVQCQKGGAPRGATVPCRLRDVVNLNRRLVMGEDGRRNPRTENLGALSHIVGGHFHYGMHTLVPEGRKYFYVTVVREPLSTWISGMRYHDKSLKTVSDVRNAAEKFLPRGSNRFYQNGLTYLGAVDGLPLGRKAPMPEKLVSALSNLEDVLVVGVVESWSTTIDLLQAMLDTTDRAPFMWDRYRDASKKKNKASKSLSSVDIVRDLRSDGYWGDIRRFLLFENAFYAAAIARHALACKHVLGEDCRLRRQGGLGVLLNASLLAPDLLPSGDIDAASLVNSQPEKPRVSPVAVASAHAVLAEAKRQRAVRDKQRKNRKKKKKLLPVTEQL